MPPARRRKTGTGSKQALRIELDGRTYVIDDQDVTPRLSAELRREVGLSWSGLMRAMGSDPDLDLVAGLVWLARKVAGEDVSYDTVLDSIGYDATLDVKVEDKRKPAAAEGDDSPEA